ncbi:alpha/beta hydrolase [Altererythrobacter sp. CAU 1778]
MLDRRNFGLAMSVGTLASVAPLPGLAHDRSEMDLDKTSSFLFSTRHVPGNVEVHFYTPPGYLRDEKPVPLILMLHGGNGSSQDLLRFTDMIGREMASGRLAPMVIAMPSARRSLYMDFRDGSQRWEKMIVDDLLPHLRETLNVSPEASTTCITGISMGGLGALRIAFKHPHLFAAVAALEPAIEPALAWANVGKRVHFWRPESVLKPIFGDPIDELFWQDNNPANIASRDPARLEQLAIYLEVGDQDLLHLYDGAEFLHRILFDARLAHEYRLVHGADHVGPSLFPRVLDALKFLERQIYPPDWITEDVNSVRAAMERQKQNIGMEIEPPDPRKLR